GHPGGLPEPARWATVPPERLVRHTTSRGAGRPVRSPEPAHAAALVRDTPPGRGRRRQGRAGAAGSRLCHDHADLYPGDGAAPARGVLPGASEGPVSRHRWSPAWYAVRVGAIGGTPTTDQRAE